MNATDASGLAANDFHYWQLEPQAPGMSDSDYQAYVRMATFLNHQTCQREGAWAAAAGERVRHAAFERNMAALEQSMATGNAADARADGDDWTHHLALGPLRPIGKAVSSALPCAAAIGEMAVAVGDMVEGAETMAASVEAPPVFVAGAAVFVVGADEYTKASAHLGRDC
jgi:hypothetical protein